MTASRAKHRDNKQELTKVIDQLRKWLTQRGWRLIRSWSLFDHVDWTEKYVAVNRRRTLQSQVFGILHEIGHIILCETSDYISRFSEAHEFKHRKEKRHETLRVRASVLGEEWEAWTLGESLAKKLDLKLDYLAFRDSRNIDLKSYAEWNVNG